MSYERIHAVAFSCNGYGTPFRDQISDLLHDNMLVFYYSRHDDVKDTGKILTFEKYMEKLYKYTVAGHTFGVSLPEEFDPVSYLNPYLPFVEEGDAEPLFVLNMALVDSFREVVSGKVKECLNDEAPYFWIFEEEGGKYSFAFSYTKSHPDCVLSTSDDFKHNKVFIRRESAKRYLEFALSNAMMLLYTFCTSSHNTLMVHASVTLHDGKGYMFLGKSGTGKSTHSRLWLNHIDDTELLNDDNPVIRVIDGEAYVYGTPWSGKTPCYKNMSVPLAAVVRLSQAPHNRISLNTKLHAYASLMPACSCMRWDSDSVNHLHKTVEQVINIVPVYHLECLPDKDAAVLCHSTVKR